MAEVRPTPTQLENDLASVGLTPLHKTQDGSAADPNQPGEPFPEPPEAPVLSLLLPNTVASGDPDLTLSCRGSNFTDRTVVHFGDYDEPTTLVSATEVTTIVKPSLFAPAPVPVYLHSGGDLQKTQTLTFTFTEPAGASQRAASEPQ